MFNIVGETPGKGIRSCFHIAKTEDLDAERLFPIGCPHFVRISAILKEMIDFALRLRKNFSEKVKKVLRWLLCAPLTDSTSLRSSRLMEIRAQRTQEEQAQRTQEEQAQRTQEEQAQRTQEEQAQRTQKQAQRTEFPERQCTAVTFQNLPPECQLRVFSYLTIEEKGRAERVCAAWRDSIRTPLLWNRVDLTQFPFRCRCPGNGCSDARCYASYKDRTEQFLNYLAGIRPNLREFLFAFDIIDYQDDWLRLLRGFIDSVCVQNLKLARLNWKETPVKPHPSENATWSSNNYNDLMYRHRRRQRHFISFFDYFTASAPNLSTLILPFDWSVPSIRFLRRLSRLESLILESYFVPQPFQQETLDDLMGAVPNVTHLGMTVCIGSGVGMVAYRLASKKLRSLDLSRCQGLGLEEVCLPSLVKLRTSCKPYVCPFLDGAGTSAAAPCLYEVLRSGAPALLQIDDHVLRRGWRENIYAELDSVLCAVCSCAQHKPV